MEFNFIEFLNESISTCRSKSDFAECVNNEVIAVSRIDDERTYMDQLVYKHQLELLILSLKCGALVNLGTYSTEINALLNSLED